MFSTPRHSIFEQHFGFPEKSPEFVRKNLRLDRGHLISTVNGKTYGCGHLEMPTLNALREQSAEAAGTATSNTCLEVVGDAQSLHADPANANALFQVASQFNLLEMCGPNETPEMGVSKYAGDPTQGPACALACFPGTVYRNYFVPLGGHTGQSREHQVDCLEDLGRELGNTGQSLWRMRNGYALATARGLEQISERLKQADPVEKDRFRGLLRVGIQRDTAVTLPGAQHRVNQLYASALPVGYSEHSPEAWEPFARLVLEAAYEATLRAAMLTPGKRVFLTLLGGGVFGNRTQWIVDAIQYALNRLGNAGLDISIVSYRTPNPALAPLMM